MAQGILEFFHLRCFVAVDEELNVRGAAVPLSKQIASDLSVARTILDSGHRGAALPRD